MKMLLLLIAVLSAAAQAAQSSPQAPAPPTCPELATTMAGLSSTELAAALNRVSVNDVRLRDWAQLNRYRDANRTVTPSGGEARVVFMGDSITDLWQQPRFGTFFGGGKPYVDRGISGQTTPQMLIRFKPDVVALKPKAVVILGGTNDIAGNTGLETNEEIEQNLASMSEIAHANGIKVVFASITPVSESHVRPGAAPQTTSRPMARIKAVNEWMKSYAASHGDVYLDYFSAMTDDKGLLRAELSEDDLHPNAAGYAIMGPLAEAAIQKALK